MAAPDLGSKTTITIGASAMDGGTTMDVTGCSINGVSREVIPTSHFLTAVANTFLPSDRYDGGELVIQAQLDHTAWVAFMADVYGTGSTAPTEGDSSSVDVVLGGVAAEIVRFSAFITNTDYDIPDEGLMTCEMTFKVTGNIEFVVV